MYYKLSCGWPNKKSKIACVCCRVDDLYRFLMVWVPHLYGDLNESTVADRGYELVDSDTELWEAEEGGKHDGRRGSDDDDLGDLTRESWEVSVNNNNNSGGGGATQSLKS